MSSLQCELCNAMFTSAGALAKHKNRKTVCMSADQLRELLSRRNELQARCAVLESKVTQLETENNRTRRFLLSARANALPLVIKASFLSEEKVKEIKEGIQTTMNEKEMREYIAQCHPTLVFHRITISGGRVEIILHSKEECQICFTNTIKTATKCKVCKTTQICVPCEKMQMAHFPTCAFCQTPYK